jgi:TRAP-type mannitol/chloroaromatic compound transport system permease small subunit
MKVVYESFFSRVELNAEVWSFVLYLILYVLIVVFAIYTSVFAYFKLNKPGISKEVRSLVFKRHVAAILIYTACNLYVMATAIAVIKN